MRALVCAWVAALLCGCASAQAPGPGSFSFSLIGDMPYFRYERPWVEDIMRDMGEHDLAFVVHAGDIKSGSEPCTDDVMLWNRKLFDSSRHPLVFIPGDNEWTDCYRPGAGGYDPEERLRRLRAIFYRDEFSLGQRRIRLDRQSADPRYSAYSENVRWQHGVVLFVGLNVPGSNNNLGRTPAADAEYRRRNAANIAWLKQSFELANRRLMRAVVVVIHANPLFELPESEKSRRGYNDFLRHLNAETIAFGKPVMLMHGDTHHFRVDHPMVDRATRRPIKTFTRVETFGSPFLGWVKVTVDTARPELFVIEPMRYRPKGMDGPDGSNRSKE